MNSKTGLNQPHLCSPSSILSLFFGFLVNNETYHNLFLGIVSQQIGVVFMEKKMSSIKYEIEKFIGVNDLDLWHLKMQALLVQQSFLEALKG